MINKKDQRKEIKEIIEEFSSVSHGKIFRECCQGDQTVEEFVKESRIGNNNYLEMDPDDEDAILVGKAFQESGEAGLIKYAELNSSNGEWAGSVFRACYNDGNLELARKIEDAIYATNSGGWDS